MEYTIAPRGGVEKMLLNFEYPTDESVTLDSIDFEVIFYTNKFSKVKIKKEKCLREERNGAVNYYAWLFTGELNEGLVKTRLTAFVPDADFPEGIRAMMREGATNLILV